MSKRIVIAQVQPQALNAMMGIEHYLAEIDLAFELKELIKMRASIINNCAYCIDMHSKAALEGGIETNKLFAVAAWRESPLFNETEQAVLALTDQMTLVADQGVCDRTYQAAAQALGEKQLAQVMMQIIMINAWTRFAVATQMQH
ncbi:carboxymuconolactone decarboxylase family protein [Psychromonas ossibalaenae]|uniref:carboxymuconolactone decarboxylase family protein n=1 Tax=Psychromonas ossibalaenae TaxID=444922 RepID=UPI000377BE8D|nr:carboxymuconolactone decarboxylase family protein [Psychromonas ossibalaenae]